MNAERLRAYILTLPHAVETMQWGANLVFWTGDKAIGGKMFALINLEDPLPTGADGKQANRRVTRHALMMYSAGPARYSELLEREGISPAPYMARIHWVAVERCDIFTPSEWQRELRAAHDLTFAKLPKKVLAALALPTTQRRRLISQRRKLLADREPASTAKKRAKK
jgi:predicted DNA-binding protein (MmcQ/YjbR family)